MATDQLVNLLAGITLVEMMVTVVRNAGLGLVTATASFPETAAITTATAYRVFQSVTITSNRAGLDQQSPSVSLVQLRAA